MIDPLGHRIEDLIAANLAKGIALENAVQLAQTYVRNLLRHR